MANKQNFPNPKNLVKISRLKQVVKDIEKQNYAIEQRLKGLNSNEDYNESSQEDLKNVSENNKRIAKYNAIIKSGKRYKVNF